LDATANVESSTHGGNMSSWHSPPPADLSGMFSNMRQFYLDRKFCDLHFVCDVGKAESVASNCVIECHKIVMAALSTSIRQLLVDSDKSNDEIISVVNLPDCDASDARDAVDAVYELLAGGDEKTWNSVFSGKFASYIGLERPNGVSRLLKAKKAEDVCIKVEMGKLEKSESDGDCLNGDYTFGGDSYDDFGGPGEDEFDLNSDFDDGVKVEEEKKEMPVVIDLFTKAGARKRHGGVDQSNAGPKKVSKIVEKKGRRRPQRTLNKKILDTSDDDSDKQWLDPNDSDFVSEEKPMIKKTCRGRPPKNRSLDTSENDSDYVPEKYQKFEPPSPLTSDRKRLDTSENDSDAGECLNPNNLDFVANRKSRKRGRGKQSKRLKSPGSDSEDSGQNQYKRAGAKEFVAEDGGGSDLVETARQIMKNGGRIEGICLRSDGTENGRLMNSQVHKTSNKSIFKALIAAKKVDDGDVNKFVGVPIAWSDPTCGEDLCEQFDRVTRSFKYVFGYAEGDMCNGGQNWVALAKPTRIRGGLLPKRKGERKLTRRRKDGSLPSSAMEDVVVNKALLKEHEKKSEQELREMMTVVEAQLGVSDPEKKPATISQSPIELDLSQKFVEDFRPDFVFKLDWRVKWNKAYVFYSCVTPESEAASHRTMFPFVMDVWYTSLKILPESPLLSERMKKVEKAVELRKVIGALSHVQCDECGELIVVKNLRMHKKLHRRRLKEADTIFKCDGGCDIEFRTVAAKRLHEVKKKCCNTNQVKCEHCKFVGVNQKVVDEHAGRIHVTIICEICAKVFGDRGKLNNHITCAHKVFHCKVCGEDIIGFARFQKHEEEHKGPYPCDECSFVARSRIYLKAHMATTHLEHPHFCPECGKGFVTPNKVRIHMMNVHIKSRPHVCRFKCGAAYNDSSTLRQHHHKKHDFWGKIDYYGQKVKKD
jgi:hypothetical protein